MNEPTAKLIEGKLMRIKERPARNESGIGTMSIRAIIALILVCAVVALAWRTPDLAKDVVVLAAMAVTFFFQQKPATPPAPPAQPLPPITPTP